MDDAVTIEHDLLTGAWHVSDRRGLADAVTVDHDDEADPEARIMAQDLGGAEIVWVS